MNMSCELKYLRIKTSSQLNKNQVNYVKRGTPITLHLHSSLTQTQNYTKASYEFHIDPRSKTCSYKKNRLYLLMIISI